MAATEALIGYGTKIFVTKAGTGATRTQLLEIKDVEFPNAQADEIEVTHMESPGFAKEYIGGLIDNGEVAFAMNWVPGSATDILLAGIAATRETVTLEFVLPGKTTGEKYKAFCKGYSRSSPVSEALTAEATFRISGLITTP